MSVCPQCGTLFVGRDAEKDQMRARIAALEEELVEVKQERKELRIAIRNLANDFNDLSERCGAAEAEVVALRNRRLPCREAEVAQARYEAAEAERDRLRKGLRLIIDRPPGQAHRIAIQMLEPREGGKG